MGFTTRDTLANTEVLTNQDELGCKYMHVDTSTVFTQFFVFKLIVSARRSAHKLKR